MGIQAGGARCRIQLRGGPSWHEGVRRTALGGSRLDVKGEAQVVKRWRSASFPGEFTRDCGIVERQRLAADDLPLLVALSAHEDHVVRLREIESPCNGSPAIRLYARRW